jgi:hypothetical protein
MAAIFLLFFWFGFSRFDVRRDLVPISKKEFNELLKLR